MLFPWETLPFEGQGVAGRSLTKEGKSGAAKVIYHTPHLSLCRVASKPPP